jgi:signal transduction histidine kinase
MLLPVMPWLVCAVSLTLTTLAVALHLQNVGVPGAGRYFDPVLPAAAFFYPILGAWLVSRGRQGARVGWLFCTTASLSVALFAEQWSVYGLVTSPASWPGTRWMSYVSWIAAWAVVPGLLVPRTLLLLLLPSGRPPSPRWSPVGWTVATLIVLIGVATALAPEVSVPYSSVTKLLDVPGAPRLQSFAEALTGVVLLIFAPICLGSLLLRYLRSGDQDRPQSRLFAVAGSLVVLVPPLTMSLPLVVHQALGFLAFMGLPAAVVIAIIRYRLYGLTSQELETLITTLALCAGLSAILITVYLSAGGSLGSPLAMGVAVAAALAAWHPLARLIQAVVERPRRETRAYRVLRELGQRLESTKLPADVLPDIAQTIASALRLPYVRVEVGHAGGVTAAAAHGEPPSLDQVRMPMRYRNEQVGTLTVAPRAGHPLDSTDLGLVRAVADQAGVAAFAVRLTEDLRQSRERLVTAREEEKAQLSIRLHQDVKQDLTAAMFSLDAARYSITRQDSASAIEMMADAKRALDSARQEVRHLSRDLRPPALDELGLVGALTEMVRVLELTPGAPGVAFRVDGDIAGLTHAVESAAYGIAREALLNVYEHAGVDRCELVLLPKDGWMELMVRDEGTHSATSIVEGVGIPLMRRSAEDVGGECYVERGPFGGWCVTARLPASDR